MRLTFQDPGPSLRPPARWHVPYEEPATEAPIEVDLGDCRIWRGVRYARHLECFVDEDTGAVIPVVMWRYAVN